MRLALPIDPMLAAEMIYRASPAVWEIVKVDIIAFVDRWHRPGMVDRAARFMIMTGRPEFETRVWPLASNANSQIQLETLHTAPRFRPSVLGPDLRSKVEALPETAREHLLGSIASESGVDGMDLATELATADPSAKVQAEVVESLQFRRADRHAARLLAAAHDETWALVAKRGYADQIRDPVAVARLRSERDRALSLATEPVERLRLLLVQAPDHPGRDAGITAAIADTRFPVKDQQDGLSFYAQQRAPTAVLEGLRQRLEAGLELPFHAYDLLDQLAVTDEGRIAAAILDVSRDNRDVNAVAVMAGPMTVDALVCKYLGCAQALKARQNDRSLRDEYQRLRSRIGATRASFVVAAVAVRGGGTDDPDLISSLASLISLHGDHDDRKSPIPVDPAVKPQLIGILRSWVEAVISSPSGGRYHLSEVSNAIGRVGFHELVPELKRLLDEDLVRLKKAREGFTKALKRGDIHATSDARMRYGNQYREAFVRLGDDAATVAAEYLEDRVFGFDAALVLKAISDKQLKVPEPSFRRQWPWFDEVAAARAERAAYSLREPANALAAPIFAAIDRLAKSETDKEGQLLAIQIARIALAMPHSDQDALIARVMTLPQLLRAKRELLAAIVLDGQVLDVDIVMQGVDEWLQEAPKNAWNKKQNTWEIEPWLELLPFTTRPEAVIEGLTKVKAFYGTGWAKRWERVLIAVAGVPGAEGEALLAALARAHKDIAGDFEWMRAILSRDSAAAVLLYVDLFIEGVFGRGPHAVEAWHVGRELAAYVQKFPQLKAELKKRYGGGAAPAQAMFEHFFGESGDDDALMAMVTKYAATNRNYNGAMDRAVRAVALWHEPVRDGSNSFYIHPTSVAHIRKFLFGLLRGTPQETALAKSCLVAIDVLRDEHGIAVSDTRHPDVLSEIPWPLEAG